MAKRGSADERSPNPFLRGNGRRRLRPCCLWTWVVGGLAILCPIGSEHCAGQAPAGSSSTDLSQSGAAFVPADRSVIILLDRTRELLEQGRYSEAVQCLDRILGRNEDFFFKPDVDSSVRRSIKSEARRLLGSIPASGRQSYELQFGSLARSMLDEAVETGDIPMVAEVVRRYFHTNAGYEATFLLGLHHMDHGRPLLAALTLQRLQDETPVSKLFEPSLSLAMAQSWLGAGMPVQARLTLDTLRESHRDRVVNIEGREVPLFETADDSVEWLLAALGPGNTPVTSEPVDWTVHGGSPQRNAVSQGSRPLMSPEWFVPTTDNPGVEAMIDRLRQQQEEREKALLPGLHPLVVNDVVLMRTATNLLAVDLETGKRLWEVAANDPFEAAMNPPPDGRINYQPNIESGLRLRLWGDGVFGTLASDGQLVFAVEDLQLPLPAIYSRGLLVPGNVRPSSARMTSNRLAAFDIRSEGKLRWEIGGSHAEKLSLAGAFFLGPPLPLLGDLYVLAEIDGEVCLLALDAEDGDLLWQQQLDVVDQSVFQDSLRRVSGVSPSYADGILVCPTSHHSIVALELTTRSLLWKYTYAEHENVGERVPNRLTALRHRLANPEDRWIDSSLVVADGHVLATPTDSERLHCLSLHDGKLLWHAPREDKLFVAAVRGGNVIVATRKGLTALNLENGKTAWENPLAACPANSEPSGRGFTNGKLYYLPLTGSKLMVVDLATGRVDQIVRSRHGRTLGNLVCHDGKIVSQRADGIESYHQLDALRREVNERLDAQPEDPRALALRGEILWDDGKLDDAVDCLRKSLQSGDSIRARTLFREVMLDGLDKHFARYHTFRNEIESLLESARDWSVFHRLIATGWERAGDYDKALAEFRLLVDRDLQYSNEDDDEIDAQVDENYSVRQHRWIRTRLLAMAEAVPADQHAQLLRWADETLQSAEDVEGPNAIGRALRYFDGLPGTQRFKQMWIERLVDAGRLSEAELALIQVTRTPDNAQPAAFERWAELLVNADRPANAVALLAEIETRWSDVPFANNSTGHQWATEFADQHQAIRQSRQPIDWPRGLVKTSVTESERKNVVLSYVRNSIPFLNGKGLFFGDLVIEQQRQQQQQIVAKNGVGQIVWRFPLDTITERDQLPTNQNVTRLDACGHLLILSLGNQVVALDTLVTEEDGTPTIAWRESMDRVDPSFLQHDSFPVQMRNARGWLGNSNLVNRANYALGPTFVFGESLICVKRSRSCAALDPATGKTLWQRDGISAQNAIFGDERYVLIAPPRATEATVLRAVDGAELESCAIPPDDQRLMTMGRKILCWEPHGEYYHLKLIDPLESGESRVIWGPRSYARESKPKQQIIDHDLMAVFNPKGKFQLIRLADGKPLIDTQLEEGLTDVVVFRRKGHFLIVANNGTSPRDPKRHVSQVTGLRSRRIGVAGVYCFDSQGTPLWKKPSAVKDHSLPLVQPQDVPCLTFVCMVRGTTPGQPRQAGAEILCLDTRSGAIVADEQFANASHALEIVAAPDESKVEIRMQQETLLLQFTDEPVPAQSSVKGTAVRAPDSPLEAIWRAVTEGATTREGKYRSRNSAPKADVEEDDEPDAAKASDQAASERNSAAEKPPTPSREAVVPPPLEPAIRSKIVPE